VGPERTIQDWKRIVAAVLLVLAGVLGALPRPVLAQQQAVSTHGIAMHGRPALQDGFAHLPTVNPDAPRGGQLTLGVLGTFDSLNPLIFRGTAAPGVTGYVYESLLARADDEPFSLYGLIAERVTMPENRSSITFHLNPAARFSDGRPITPEDVVFSHKLLKEKSWPALRSHYSKVASVEILPPRSVRFTFAVAGDREVPLLLGLMRVLPRHAVVPEQFERTTLEPPVGSGPYLVDKVDPGRSVTFRRNPDWWARNLPVTRGRYNFDVVRYEFFRDSSSLFEAFRSGLIDLRIEDDPGKWAEGYRFPAVADGRVVKAELTSRLPAVMTALAFNARRPVFADARVRRALGLLFDAEWLNRSLYNGLYKRTESFFERSVLSAHGRPADAFERDLLAPFAGLVPADVLEGRHRQPVSDGTGRNRDNQIAAVRLLEEAGYRLNGGRMLRVADGRHLAFEFIGQTRAQERLVGSYARSLADVGIQMRMRSLDSSQYSQRTKSFDYDMILANWAASLSPGNEQLNRWSSRAADTPNAFNFAGIKNPAVDAMIEALLKAETAETFTSSVRALDRALISGDYVIPLFHLPKVWVAHKHGLKRPEKLANAGVDVDSWWWEPKQ
jgi:peptide/nickel transport system substrate-binding protein